MTLVIHQQMPWQFAFVATSTDHAFLAVALAVELVALVRHDSFDVAVATFTRTVDFVRRTEETLRASVAKRAGVAFLAIARDFLLGDVAASSKIFVRFRARTRLTRIVRMPVIAFSARFAMLSARVVRAISALASLLVAIVTSPVALAGNNFPDQFFEKTRLGGDIAPPVEPVGRVLARVTSESLGTGTSFNACGNYGVVVAVDGHSVVHRHVSEAGKEILLKKFAN